MDKVLEWSEGKSIRTTEYLKNDQREWIWEAINGIGEEITTCYDL